MESDEIRAALHDADRTEAAPWIDFPPTPWWYVPVASLWTGLCVLAVASHSMALFFALIAAEFAFLTWYRRYRGMWPSGPAPREFRRPIAIVVTAVFVALALAVAAYLLGGPWAASASIAVAMTAILSWYEHAYADAARRTRERLA